MRWLCQVLPCFILIAHGSKLPLSPKLLSSRSIRYSLLAAQAVAAWTVSPVRGEVIPSREEIYANYPYQRPTDLLRFVESYSSEGDAKSVLFAMDRFAEAYPMYKLSPTKASILVRSVKSSQPKRVLEIGSFFGYSAIHIAQTMPGDCLLCCIEGNPENAEIARMLLQRSFANKNSILERVKIVTGLSSDVLHGEDSCDRLFRGTSINGNNFRSSALEEFDFVFLDHDKNCYLPDLITMEEKLLLNPRRCTIVADNVIFPGAPDFLRYVGIDDGYLKSLSFDVELPTSIVIDSGAWKSRIVEVPFERVGFETQYRVKQDGMSISSRVYMPSIANFVLSELD